MKTLQIRGREKTSGIHVGASLADLGDYLPCSRTIIITDENVAGHYADRFPPGDIVQIGTGEAAKTLETVSMLYKELIARQADRSVFLAGIGGGIVCDVTGFVASTYLRGVRFGYCPSTLLAQVDASVGGKTGVNFEGYKNMVGVFNQPEFVLCDPLLLRTLPEREVACGFAEVVKHAAIADADYFAFLERESVRACCLEAGVMERVIHDSVGIKAAIVGRDEKEKGERRKLNFGHTFGHGLEKTTDFAHGEAVSIGMMVAAELSRRRGLLSPGSVDRLEALLAAFHLPVAVPADVDREQLMDAVCRDKKRAGERLYFVLLRQLGEAVVEPVSIRELEESLSACL
ncbi:MAG TPA: 3-dehydroquinate synthase [Desulfosalsimonadaceae bacterium]|nr:3-dehydroquinate synthase [Desulfosalsimonadaceae bacterium]